MKILYLIAGTYNSAGTERVVSNKINFFAQLNGYEVTVATTDQNNRSDFYVLPKNVKRVDFGINFFKYDKYPTLVKMLIFFFKNTIFKNKLSKYLFDYRQDIVVSLMPKSAGFLHKIQDGSKKVMEHHFSHSYTSLFSDAFNRSRINRWLYDIRGKMEVNNFKKFDAFVVLTNQDADLWGKDFKNLVIIPNSLTFKTEQITDFNSKIVLSVGRLNYQKGYDMLIEIWNLICKNNSEWQLHIYGNGEEEAKLNQQIESYGLASNVKIYPATKNIEKAFLSASVYVMTSRFEGFPMVLAEAMSFGLPPVSFACECGPKDMIENEQSGFLIDNYDIAAFSNKLKLLINNYELRRAMGQAAQKNIKQFSEENIMAKWVNLFEKLTKK
ncbi:MAG: glycosyltransferase family 4 protein [Prevotellaceae bacterium]|jgi:glycosyltransferase involved in cell wall biosynthesis|nr:glycosyltransferase family 4 protein [Prevotellaceae bacterium]